MAKEYGDNLPTPQEWAVLKDRLNGAAGTARGVEARVGALDESFKTVWARLKKLEEAAAGPQAATAEEDAEEEEEEPEPPRDWLAVQDVETARLWLKELQEWMSGTYRWLPQSVELPPCWAWHPALVQELLAISSTRVQAYEVGGSTVSDFLTRWWPTFLERLRTEIVGRCGPQVHREGTRAYEVDPGQVAHLAAWWVQSRDLKDRPGAVEITGE